MGSEMCIRDSISAGRLCSHRLCRLRHRRRRASFCIRVSLSTPCSFGWHLVGVPPFAVSGGTAVVLMHSAFHRVNSGPHCIQPVEDFMLINRMPVLLIYPLLVYWLLIYRLSIPRIIPICVDIPLLIYRVVLMFVTLALRQMRRILCMRVHCWTSTRISYIPFELGGML